jgi:hypothetical protein
MIEAGVAILGEIVGECAAGTLAQEVFEAMMAEADGAARRLSNDVDTAKSRTDPPA